MSSVLPRQEVDRAHLSTPATINTHENLVRVASFPPNVKQNPYQRLLYDGLRSFGFELVADNRLKAGWLLRRRGDVRILHFHWIQGYYTFASPRIPDRARLLLSGIRVGLFQGRLRAARLLGYRIVWTIHQVRPHESTSPRLDRLGSRALARASHLLLAHDHATARQAEVDLQLRPGEVHVVPHGSYVGVYPAGRDARSVRDALGVDQRSVLFLSFGHIRGYKDIGLLLDAFAATAKSLPDAALVIAGLPMDDGSVEAVRAAAAADARIHPLLEFVPDDRVAEVFGAADVAVLPRGDGGTSGALILALSLELPVIAASTPSYAELVGEDGAGWLFQGGDAESLACALEAAAAEGRDGLRASGAVAFGRAESLRWDHSCASIAERLRKLPA
jgi:beta-1,4-mannosyltransferase